MKKRIALTLILLILLTAAAAVWHLATRTQTPPGTIRVEWNGRDFSLVWKDMATSLVKGSVVDGKGDSHEISAKGVLLTRALETLGIEAISEVTVTASDEYSAKVDVGTLEAPDRVYLIEQADGGVQMIVFGDPNSRRNVSNVVRLVVQ